MILECWSFPGGSVGKESSCNAGDSGLICRFGRSPEKVREIPRSRRIGEKKKESGNADFLQLG